METGSVKAHVNPDMEVGGKAFVVVAMTTDTRPIQGSTKGLL